MLNNNSLVNLLWRWGLILTASGLAVTFGNSAFAQIQPDNTLGTDNSVVNDIDAFNQRIDGGVKLDANLFHSFQEFNIGEDRSVYFANPQGITDIFSRVTGNNPSNIFGKLGVLGAANLFLINPNGIVFGENASLDVGGSFVASTANGVEFGERGLFSASNPEVPRLLNVSPSALFFNAVNNQAGIQNNSIAPSGTDPAGFDVFGLRVADGKSLLLVGGDVSMDGGELHAYGGRIELGGLATPGNVNILFEGDNLKLGFPENVTRADVSLNNNATAVVSTGSSIAVNARNLNILGSSIVSGVVTGEVNNELGNIEINTTDTTTIDGTISTTFFTGIASGLVGGSGSAADITINTGSLEVTNALISSISNGEGNAGNVTIIAKDKVSGTNSLIGSLAASVGNGADVSIEAQEISLANSAIITNSSGKGSSGNIQIKADNSVFVTGSSTISSDTFGTGNAGSIDIEAGNLVSFDGVESNDRIRQVSTRVNPLIVAAPEFKGERIGGDINIKTGSLLMKDAKLETSTLGKGDAGNVKVTATDAVSLVDALILSTVQAGGDGEGGNVIINTNNLQFSNEASIVAFTDGQGDAGDVTINASNIKFTANSIINNGVNNEGVGKGGEINIKTDSLALLGGSQINSFLYGQKRDNQGKVIYPGGNGNAGNVKITANTVEMSGMDENGFSSAILTISERGSSGFAGDISIKADNLQIADGAVIAATTFNASDSGDIFINTKNFEAINGGQVVSATRNSGNAGTINFINSTGNIKISGFDPNFQQELDRAREFIKNNPSTRFEEVSEIVINEGANSGIFANTARDSTGDGGIINLQGNSISINNGAQISAQSLGTKKAGNINITLGNILQADNGEIVTTSEKSSGGAIKIRAKDIRLSGDSDIATNVFSGEGGGDITIDANTIIALDDSDILSFAGDGKGGNITFNTQAFFSKPLYNPSSSTNSNANALTELDNNNRVDVNASGAVSGTITGVPDTTFIQDNLTELPDNQIDTSTIIANSCIVRSNQQNGTFLITGSGGLPQNPSDAPLSNYSTGSIRSIPSNSEKSPASNTRRKWKIGDPVVEPQGVYKLPNGQLVLSRECK